MKKNNDNESIENNTLAPIVLNPEQEIFCELLDTLNETTEDWKFSDFYRGALFALRVECEKNPEQLIQAAVSLREIIYPFFSSQIKNSQENKNEFFNDEKHKEIKKFIKILNDAIHHFVQPSNESNIDVSILKNREIFTKEILHKFENLILRAIKPSWEILKKTIDKIVENYNNKKSFSGKLENVRQHINYSANSRSYFYKKINENWINLLIENNFLDFKNEKNSNIKLGGFFYHKPEFEYLHKIATTKPEKIFEVVSAIKISAEKENLDLIEQFIYIFSLLNATELSKMISIIWENKWIQLEDLRNEEFSYKQFFTILKKENKFKKLLELAKIVLSIKSTSLLSGKFNNYSTPNNFYFKNLTQTKVFENLINISSEYTENALQILCDVFSKIIKSNIYESTDKSVFEFEESGVFLDFDFFTEYSEKPTLTPTAKNFENLFFSIQEITKKLINQHFNNWKFANDLYDKYFKILPNCKSVLRLQFFILSLHREAFKEKLKNIFLKFSKAKENKKNYNEIFSENEYVKLLNISFVVFEKSYQQDYINKIFKYLREDSQPTKNLIYYEILCSIFKFLTKKQKNESHDIFGLHLDPKNEPIRMFGSKPIFKSWKPAPFVIDGKFAQYSIIEISKKLKNIWKPSSIFESNKGKPMEEWTDTKSIQSELKKDINNRLIKYLNNANLFFQKDVLDENYTYYFFEGVNNALKNENLELVDINFDKLINLIHKIAISVSNKSLIFERVRSFEGEWLMNWRGVLSSILILLKTLFFIKAPKKNFFDFSLYRNKLLKIIKYLLSAPNSKFYLTQNKDCTKFYEIAINSIKGQAFEIFIYFLRLDAKYLINKTQKIKEDVKKVYLKILKNEKSESIMFMFGFNIWIIYFYDKKWAYSLLSQVFSDDEDNQSLYFAAWYGYLENTLYGEIFSDEKFVELYSRGTKLKSNKNISIKNLDDHDRKISQHFALAFVYFREEYLINEEHFKVFWNSLTINIKKNFISNIGIRFIAGDVLSVEGALDKDIKIKGRLRGLWEWILKHEEKSEVFESFGYWFVFNEKIFEPEWIARKIRRTLEKTNGKIEDHYHLEKNINKFVDSNPVDTLEILKLFLLDEYIKNDKTYWWEIPIEIIDAFTALYNHENSKIKASSRKLIESLVSNGSHIFGALDEIIK